MENTHVEQCASRAVNVTVRSARPCEYLTEREVDRLIEAAKGNRWGHRDATAILIAYRHGLRASELVALRWSDLELQTGRLHAAGPRAARRQCTQFWPGRVVHCVGCRGRRHRPRTCSQRAWGAAERGRLSANGGSSW